MRGVMRTPNPALVTANPGAADWSGARGEKWLSQLAGMEPTLAPIDGPLVDALSLPGASRVADVACGGGGTTLAIAARADEGTVVHGYDIAPKLVEAARARVPADRAHAITFAVADVATTVPVAPYDRLASRFGTMFFADPAAAFANLARWLAPGGRFAFAVWGASDDNPWMTMVRDVVGRFVEIPTVDPDGPGPYRYGDAQKLVALLRDAGLAEVEARTLDVSLPIGGGLPPEEAARFALGAFASFGELIASAGEAATREATLALTARLAAHARADGVWVPARVHIVVGGTR